MEQLLHAFNVLAQTLKLFTSLIGMAIWNVLFCTSIFTHLPKLALVKFNKMLDAHLGFVIDFVIFFYFHCCRLCCCIYRVLLQLIVFVDLDTISLQECEKYLNKFEINLRNIKQMYLILDGVQSNPYNN